MLSLESNLTPKRFSQSMLLKPYTEARSRDSVTSFTFLAERYDAFSSAKSTMSISLCTRNKFANKILNRSDPKIQP